MRVTVLVLSIMAASACHAQQPLRVADAIKNIHALNGETVRVAGYLGECGGYNCVLFQNKAEWQQMQRWMRSASAQKRPTVEFPDFLGIGSGKLICPSRSARTGCYSEVDKEASPFTNGYVIITGKLSDICRDQKLRWDCTDRGPELQPVSFAKWTQRPEDAR